MKPIMILCSLALLSACATMPGMSQEQQFEAYRAELDIKRENGQITAAEEQEQLRDRFWQLYGRDAESAGHFAYCKALMHSAEIGDFPMQEAHALVNARESQLLATRKVMREQRPLTWDEEFQ